MPPFFYASQLASKKSCTLAAQRTVKLIISLSDPLTTHVSVVKRFTL